MSTTVITPNQDALVSEVHIGAPPGRIFQALIDPKQVLHWWTNDQCQIESFALEARKGGRWHYDSRHSDLSINGVSKFRCEGEVLEYDPPHVLAYTWIANWHDLPAQRTVVRWELAASGKGTLLRVTHSGLADLPGARKDYSGGWPGVLQQVKQFVEGKK